MDTIINYEVQNIQKIYTEYVVMAEYKTIDSEYYVCKYCGEKDLTKFKSKAHLIPEFTGNKDWFCYDECDDCNNKFSAYEYSLKSLGAFKNSHLPIEGKKKFPKYVDGYHNYSIQFQKDGKLLINSEGNKDLFKIENNRINIKSLSMPFVPLHVYKCLFKIAVSMMCSKDFKKFESSLPWLADKKMLIEPVIPHIMLKNPSSKPVIKPIAILLRRKEKYNCPEFSLIFVWGFIIFQIFLPFNKDDEDLDYSDLKLPILEDFITKDKNGKFGLAHYDMNNINRIQTLEAINFGLKNRI